MKKFDDLLSVLLGVGLILALLSAVALVAGGVMKLFGFTYDSVGSLVLYFILASLLSFVLGTAAFGGWEIGTEYGPLVTFVFLPLLAAVGVCSGFLRRRRIE